MLGVPRFNQVLSDQDGLILKVSTSRSLELKHKDPLTALEKVSPEPDSDEEGL